MIRSEISLFLKNVPGELGKLAKLFEENKINIDALTIQDASAYVQEIFKARGKSIKRIASSNSYSAMQKDAAEFALIRLLVDQTEQAIDVLSQHSYIFDTKAVVVMELDNNPGQLAAVARKLGDEDINIEYVYGTVAEPGQKCLFVFCPDNVDKAVAVFRQEM